MDSRTLKQLVESVVEEELSLINEEELEEGGFGRLMQTLSGMEGSINSVVIMTSENPMAQQQTKAANKDLRRQFEEDLRTLGLGFRKTKGKYGNIENSYVIPNMDPQDAIELGTKYRQDTVIIGVKTEQDGKPGMEFSMVTTGDEMRPTVKATDWVPMEADTEDFYTGYKGRKFNLDFDF